MIVSTIFKKNFLMNQKILSILAQNLMTNTKYLTSKNTFSYSNDGPKN